MLACKRVALTTAVYQCVRLFNSKKEESVVCGFEMTFKKSVCCGFRLINNNIISVCKHVMLCFVTTSRTEKGCGK